MFPSLNYKTFNHYT